MIASYQRPADLLRCIDALDRQIPPIDDVVVVRRDIDAATAAALAGRPTSAVPVRVVVVAAPGSVVARNAGLDACTTDILGILDDDTVPHPDWAARIVAHFDRDPTLGGLGGRDQLFSGGAFLTPYKTTVGRIEWAGRIVVDHHLGIGPPRRVDMLKGANMSFRARAFAHVRFDSRLRGRGAQPYDDLKFTLDVRRAGWTILYDPAVLVDHYPGRATETRHYVHLGPVRDLDGFDAMMHNEVLALWDELSPPRRVVFAVWSLLVGTRQAPGLVQAVRFTPRLGWASWTRFALAQKLKFRAMRQIGRPAGAC